MKKVFSFIFLVVLFALLQACGSSKETNQGISTSTQVINSGTGDGIPTPKGSNSSQPSGTKNCGANKWNVIPTKIYTLPSSSGLKIIVISMVEENRSPYWGYVYTNVGLDSSFVQTEGGFTYPVLPFFSMSPNFLYMSEGAGLPTMSPSDLLTPTALDPVSRALTATTRAVEITPTVTPTPRDQLSFALTATVQYLLDLGKAQNIPSTPTPLPTNGASQLFYLNAHQVYIPPSFAIRGWGVAQFDKEAPLGWFQAAYKVAETQNHFKLTIPSITINCIYEDGSTGMETSKPIVLDLDKDIRTIDLPVTENSLNIRNLTDWIDLAENGKIQFTSVSLAQTPFGLNMVIPYQFVNTNAGYQSTVPLSVYIIGSDGLIRENICDRKTTAGPSQSTSGKVCFSLSSRLAESLKSVYLVWSWQNERIVLGSPVNFR